MDWLARQTDKLPGIGTISKCPKCGAGELRRKHRDAYGGLMRGIGCDSLCGSPAHCEATVVFCCVCCESVGEEHPQRKVTEFDKQQNNRANAARHFERDFPNGMVR